MKMAPAPEFSEETHKQITLVGGPACGMTVVVLKGTGSLEVMDYVGDSHAHLYVPTESEHKYRYHGLTIQSDSYH